MTTSLIKKCALSPIPFVTREESGGAYWQMDSTRQIIRASGDNAYIYIPILFYPGTKIETVGVRWGGGGTGDGIYFAIQRREAEGSNKYFTDLNPTQTFTRGSTDPEQQVSWYDGSPFTIEEGFSYVIHCTSQVVLSYSEIYDIIIYTRLRLL